MNPRLVRGLDYYGHTTFEVTTTALGAQGTVLAGGRYDGLSSLLGGPPLPGVGWAAGVERLDLLQEAPLPLPRGILILPHGPSDAPDCLVLAELLRHTYGLSVSVLHAPAALGKRLTKADKGGWRHILILGDAEREARSVIWKDLKEGTQRVVLTCEIGPHLTLTYERPEL